MNKDDLELETQGESLFIKGIRRFPIGEGEKSAQTITRSLRMPKHVDREKIHASCADGVLYLALPKVEKARPQKIKLADVDQTTWKNLLGAEGADKEN